MTQTKTFLRIASLACLLSVSLPSTRLNAADSVDIHVARGESPDLQDHGIWENDVGEGFRASVESFTLGAGGAYGVTAFGSHQSHDLALSSLTYGRMLGAPVARDHWFRGNFEFRAEVFGGVEFAPSDEWLIGLAPHLRYNFATGTRWIPFFDVGAGVTATSIGPPDLSGTFEFNLQVGTGASYFFRDNCAVTLEARYIHLSCAGLSSPNSGVNCVLGMLGVSWFF